MDTKIVFFDIDGTIYSYEKGIPKDTAKAIELLKANGHIPIYTVILKNMMNYRIS